MGQGSSAETDPGASGGGSSAPGGNSEPVKTCYYELLAISRDATQDDIKKAYKKKALEFHPDRNYNDTERATRLFTEVQAAYEVLSDPQERAWYDSHRDAILQNDTESSHGGSAPRAVNVTTTEDVMKWFSLFASRLSYEDSDQKSFYSVLGRAFAKLAEEETAAAEWENEDAVHYPDFGNSKSGHEDRVKNFYTVWGNFRTMKSFSWCDVYKYSDAPDRRIKRIMEKENKRFRDAAIREFNDIVRSFVLFVRKRDPRFIPNNQSEAQRQAALLAASKEQAARQRAENAAKLRNYKAADWTKVSEETLNELYDSEQLSDEDGSNADDDKESEDEQVLRYECIVCKKKFNSEGPMNAHERSKKHTKAVFELKRQMQKENKEFDLDRDVRGLEKKPEEFTPIDDDNEEDLSGGGEEDEEEQTIEPEAEKRPSDPPATSKSLTPSDDEDTEGDDDDDYVSTSKFNARIHGSTPPTSTPSPSSQEPDLSNLALNSDAEASKPKLGKAKAKKAKRAAAAASSTPGDSDAATACATCKQSFSSNTKMFNHLRDNPAHAKPVPNGGGAKKGKGKGKRK